MTPTDHPMTDSRVRELWDKCLGPSGGHTFATLYWVDSNTARAAMRAAYDAGSAEWKANAEAAAERAERAEEKLADSVHVDEDDRPWMPLGQDDPLNAGDEVRQDHLDITITAVVARVDGEGDPWTAEHALIGIRRYGTWHVRRATPTLPTEDGAVIVPAEGCEFIKTSDGLCFYVMVHAGDGWWRGGADEVASEDITPDTWKVARND